MRKLKILALALAAVTALTALCGVGAVLAAGYAVEQRLDPLLAALSSRVRGLKLSSEITEKGFGGLKGRVSFAYALPRGNFLNRRSVEGAVDFSLKFGLFSAYLSFQKAAGSGNFDEIFRERGLEPLEFGGAAEASLPGLEASAALKTRSFRLPLPDGACQVGENSVYLRLLSLSAARAELNSAGVLCRSSVPYNGLPAYDVSLRSLGLKAEPRLTDGRLSVPRLTAGLKELRAEASTIYLIGFSPEEKVKDPSSREGFTLSNVSLDLSLDGADADRRRELTFDGVGDLAFAFPCVRDNLRREDYLMRSLSASFAAGRVDFPGLLRALSRRAAPEELSGFLSPEPYLELKNFSFEHAEESLRVGGRVRLGFRDGRLDKEALAAELEGEAGRGILGDLAGGNYAGALSDQVARGAVDFDGARYRTVLAFRGGRLTLNGVAAVSAEEIMPAGVGEAEEYEDYGQEDQDPAGCQPDPDPQAQQLGRPERAGHGDEEQGDE